MATVATIGSGATFKIGATAVGEVISITTPTLTTDAVEATHLASGGNREYIVGLKDGGEFVIEFNFTQTGYGALYAQRGVAPFAVTITEPGNDTWTASVILTSLGAEIPLDDRLTGSATFKVSGAVTYTGV